MSRYGDLVNLCMDRQKEDKKWRLEMIEAASNVISSYREQLGLELSDMGRIIEVDMGALKSDDAINKSNQLEAQMTLNVCLDQDILEVIKINFLVKNVTEGIMFSTELMEDRWMSSVDEFANKLIEMTFSVFSLSMYEMS